MAQLEDGAFVLDRILERVESAELPTAAGARGNDQNTDSIQMSALLLSKLLVSETVQQTAGDRTWAALKHDDAGPVVARRCGGQAKKTFAQEG
jgi:hypothetical protein